MKCIRFAVISSSLLAVTLSAGCLDLSTPPDGSGGSGGSDASASSGTSSSASNSSSASSSSGGPTKCESASADCGACIKCSRSTADGLCNKQYNDCLGHAGCVTYGACVANCSDAVCNAMCADASPTGVPIYDAYVSCVVCKDCYLDCDGAGTCN